jgi:hypothetical protein
MQLKCSTKNSTLTIETTDQDLVVFWENSRMIGSVGLLDMLDAINSSLQSRRLLSATDLQDLFLCRRLAQSVNELSRNINYLLETRTGEIATQLLNESKMKGGEET